MARQEINIGSGYNDESAEFIRDAFQKVNEMTTELYAGGVGGGSPVFHNVLDYGAVGNASHATGGGNDDTVAIQDAYNAAASGNGTGIVVFPGRRTYRITSTINVPQGVHTVGIGGRNASGNTTPLTIVWDGNDSTGLFEVITSDTNFFGTRFENLCIAGKTAGGTLPKWGVRFAPAGGGDWASPDTGTFFRDVLFNVINGHGIFLDAPEGYATNLDIEGGRFDDIRGGYGIYMKAGYLRIRGGVNWTGGGPVQGHGFLFVDGVDSTHQSHIYIDSLHTEVNQDMVETFAAGTNPYDRRGIIRLGVNPSQFGIQHQLLVNGWFNTSAQGPSYSAFHITGTGGTDDAIADRVSIELMQGHALNAGTTNAAANNEIRLFGGRFPVERQWPFNTDRIQRVSYSGKQNISAGFRSYNYSLDGADATRSLGLMPRTVADLGDWSPGGAGIIAYVTDSNSTTLGATVAGGGSNKVLVFWTGSAWKIFAVVN